jgi:hypothetical protein
MWVGDVIVHNEEEEKPLAVNLLFLLLVMSRVGLN